ncbi:hypothetical protein [Umezawaea tangerina]|nr:hypothetical protein [Umezawaea tangerina]
MSALLSLGGITIAVVAGTNAATPQASKVWIQGVDEPASGGPRTLA